MDRFEATLSNRLVSWVRLVDGHAKAVLGVIAALTISLFAFAAFNLGINSDNTSLIAEQIGRASCRERV